MIPRQTTPRRCPVCDRIAPMRLNQRYCTQDCANVVRRHQLNLPQPRPRRPLRRYRCAECPMESSGPGIGTHQRHSGHTGKEPL